MTILITSTEWCKAAHNDKSHSTLTHSSNQAYAVRVLTRKAQISAHHALIILELAGMLRDSAHE
jgi:hypothetical protein